MDQDIRKILQKYNLKPNFTYGQNFLIDESVLDEIVKSAQVSNKDAVLEIGPGIGNLTKKLLKTGAFVLSIEKDPKFLTILKSLKKDFKENFRFEIADALEFNFQKTFACRGSETATADLELQPKICEQSAVYKVVANIPYYITGKILKMLLTSKNKPQSITLLTQKEVAQNACAKKGDMSILAISIQLFGEPKIIRTVPAKSFYPAPKVNSAILQIQIPKNPKYKITDEKKFFSVVKACFAGKRKQIHNTLKNNLRLSAEQVFKILNDLKIDPVSRPQDLEIKDWINLSNLI